MSAELAKREIRRNLAWDSDDSPQPAPAPAPMRLLAVEQVYALAERVAKSGLMGRNRSAEEVFTLMMLCEADSIHYMEALRRYDIIEGTPALKSAVALAEFQRQGGRIKWVHSDDDSVEAIFTHRILHPDPFVVKFTLQRFIDRRICMTWDQAKGEWRMKREWSKNTAALLRARVVTAGVRAIAPGVFAGIDSTEEADDRGAPEVELPAAHVRVLEQASDAIRASEVSLPGDPPTGPDLRPYTAVIEDVAAAVGYDKWAVHEALWQRAAQTDQAETLAGRPKTRREVIERLRKLYDRDRPFARSELAAYVALRRELHAVEPAPSVVDTTEVAPPAKEVVRLASETAGQSQPSDESLGDVGVDADYDDGLDGVEAGLSG